MSDTYDLDSGPDPAALAASAPESESATVENPVYAVGIGPGNLEYLTPRAERAIRAADVVVGFETVVEFVRGKTSADALTCGYRDEAETLATFADRVADGETGTAVLMGDPNHSGYQFVGKVQAAVERPVRVIPGISSLQVAASRARTPMEETVFVTLHRSGDITPGLRRLRDEVGDRHLLVLPRPYDWMPEDVAAELLDAGASPSLEALVLERLTHEDEGVTTTTLGRLEALTEESDGDTSPFSDLSVLAVRSN
ncbi:cobalt-precorrin-7 (C(5))-methyltransferase [Haloarchaeobius iranensis]|uniref:Precorrin-6Y C5,15-methyltransferase (Decarboxylating) n=1 Tax=Haloarchaeobius iranensis TaxID=996166 RepID=A0A1G9ZNR8_9EURY|nr:cobalt-precorrin-7 (C(5))-methyltransferase [Haloarchaeobius iranensis]SDN22894.1 precorrin-6Y C5,15-methyltransferase (decarboxylating) [Haloarchaeobius iranensis]